MDSSVSTATTAENARQRGAEAPRALALDAFRGFAVLAMVMSWIVPEGVLPAWMYHAQTPPPLHRFNPNLPGITWVDVVFPAFLFSMGAAIPLALAARIERGVPRRRIVAQVLVRGLPLAWFAFYIAHVIPLTVNPNPTRATWALALLGFVLLFPILTRLPASWALPARAGVRAVGWIGAIALLASLRYPGGSGFSMARTDIIILLLANMAVFGSLVWLVSRQNLVLRLGFLGLLAALRLAGLACGWVGWLVVHARIPYVFELVYLQPLFIVIPGTIVGDMIRSWMASGAQGEGQSARWSRLRAAGVFVLMWVLVIAMVVGLKARWVWQAAVVAAALCGLGWLLVSRATTATERLLKGLFAWGVCWLALGLALEPYEGGIKKDPATMSYYFVTTGLSIFMLIAFAVVVDIWRKRRRCARLLIDNGQNALMGYAGGGNLVGPVLGLIGVVGPLEAIGQRILWLGAIIIAFYALLLGLAVAFFTRRGVLWRM